MCIHSSRSFVLVSIMCVFPFFCLLASFAKHVDHNMFRNSRSLRAHWFYNHEKKKFALRIPQISFSHKIKLNNFSIYGLAILISYFYLRNFLFSNLCIRKMWRDQFVLPAMIFVFKNSIKIYVNITRNCFSMFRWENSN